MRTLIGVITLFIIACQSAPKQSENTVSDSIFKDSRDQGTYSFSSINGMTWMMENLNFQNEQWSNYHFVQDSLGLKYGNYYSKNNLNNLCPEGWRIPDFAAIQSLINSLEGIALPERGGKKVAAETLSPLKIQWGGIGILKNDSLKHQAMEYMSIWHTSSDTLFNFTEPERKEFSGVYSIGLHIYPTSPARDSFFVEPTYDRENTTLLNCRCIRIK